MNWISVDNRLPEDRQEVLTYWAAKNRILLQTFYLSYADLSGAWWMHGGQNHHLEDGSITHWMSLPEPPAEK